MRVYESPKYCHDYNEEHYWQLKVLRLDCSIEIHYKQCVYCGFTKEISESLACNYK